MDFFFFILGFFLRKMLVTKDIPSNNKSSLWKIKENKSTLYIIQCSCMSSQVALVVKNPLANAGDVSDASLIPSSGRSSEGGQGNLL